MLGLECAQDDVAARSVGKGMDHSICSFISVTYNHLVVGNAQSGSSARPVVSRSRRQSGCPSASSLAQRNSTQLAASAYPLAPYTRVTISGIRASHPALEACADDLHPLPRPLPDSRRVSAGSNLPT